MIEIVYILKTFRQTLKAWNEKGLQNIKKLIIGNILPTKLRF